MSRRYNEKWHRALRRMKPCPLGLAFAQQYKRFATAWRRAPNERFWRRWLVRELWPATHTAMTAAASAIHTKEYQAHLAAERLFVALWPDGPPLPRDWRT